MTRFRAPSPPYLGPAAHTSAGSNLPLKRIVLHSTVSPCIAGQARKTAAYFRSPASGGSAHYAVDPKEVVQIVHDSVIAWHAPPNGNSIGVEMCDYPDAESAQRWARPDQAAMLELTADLAADLCLAYGVRPYFVGAIALRLGRKGITTHNEVSKAFGQSTHWDVGAWPRRKFMRTVRAKIAEKKKENR